MYISTVELFGFLLPSLVVCPITAWAMWVWRKGQAMTVPVSTLFPIVIIICLVAATSLIIKWFITLPVEAVYVKWMGVRVFAYDAQRSITIVAAVLFGYALAEDDAKQSRQRMMAMCVSVLVPMSSYIVWEWMAYQARLFVGTDSKLGDPL